MTTVTPEQQAASIKAYSTLGPDNPSIVQPVTIANKTYTPGAGIVSGSAPIVAQEKATTAAVTAAKSTLPETPQAPDNSSATTAHDATIANLDAYMKTLETRRQQEIASINAGFDVTKQKTETAQTKETGSTSVGIARMGGYLGGSGSGTGVMLNLAQTHRDEIVSLEAKRQDAIRQANNAIDDKQFQLAAEKVKEAKSFEETIYQRNKDFWNQQIQYNQENRAQNTAVQTQTKNTLDIISTTGVATPEAIQQIDGLYGAGTTQKYVDIVNADKTAKSTKAMYDNFKAKMDLMESIPAGVKMTFGNETITGLGKTSDLSTFHVEDASGNVSVVTKNLRTGTITTQNLGPIGTPSGNSGGATPDKIAAMTKDLANLADPNGYVSPTDYKNGLRVWLEKGNTLQGYESNFKIFADPKKAEQYDFSQYYSKSSDQLLQALFGQSK